MGKTQEKIPEIFEISGLGGDKRDRTANLLNAMSVGRGHNGQKRRFLDILDCF